jgi:hypothetical protein
MKELSKNNVGRKRLETVIMMEINVRPWGYHNTLPKWHIEPASSSPLDM